MNDIIRIHNTSNTNHVQFVDDLNESVVEMQKNGLVVEVQYQVNVIGTGHSQLVYSALVLGRKIK